MEFSVRKWYGATALLPLLAIISLSNASTVQAQTTLFDLESEPATWNPPATRTGALLTKTLTSGGITLTVSRNLTATFDIVNNVSTPADQSGKPVSWGLRSLDPFFNLTTGAYWIIDFSTPVSAFSLDYGDYGGDGDTGTLTGFSGAGGTGTTLSSASNSLPTTGTFTANTLGISTGTNSIQSITFQSIGDTGFENSVFLDNLTVTVAQAAPEPGSLALLGMAALPIMGMVWRRKRA